MTREAPLPDDRSHATCAQLEPRVSFTPHSSHGVPTQESSIRSHGPSRKRTGDTSREERRGCPRAPPSHRGDSLITSGPRGCGASHNRPLHPRDSCNSTIPTPPLPPEGGRRRHREQDRRRFRRRPTHDVGRGCPDENTEISNLHLQVQHATNAPQRAQDISTRENNRKSVGLEPVFGELKSDFDLAHPQIFVPCGLRQSAAVKTGAPLSPLRERTSGTESRPHPWGLGRNSRQPRPARRP